MNTPIYDFVTSYNNQNPSRMHMPGHKGMCSLLGIEHLDITEIDGADNLWEADGIIAESEANASAIFGCPTFYSTEGSSLAIRGMLFLIKKWAHLNNRKPLILAGRNAHKTFINTVSVLDIDVDWIMPLETDSYQVCTITAEDISSYLDDIDDASKPAAVYLTSPDYLGNITDIQSIARVCHENDILLIVDNAHGAYLKFIGSPDSTLHPIDLGADLCCDSAHKTLPVLTGGAYLHVREASKETAAYVSDALTFFRDNAKSAMMLFGSTSPSYLIMQSLDLCNSYLCDNAAAYSEATAKVTSIESKLITAGYVLKGNEPIKITIDAKAYGYFGYEISEYLVEENIYVEYYDNDYVVCMITPMTSDDDLDKLTKALLNLVRKPAISSVSIDLSVATDSSDSAELSDIIKSSDSAGNYRMPKPVQAISYKDAILSDSEIIDASESVGRILSEAAVSTPPCVPLYMCGERIDVVPPTQTVRVVKTNNQ